MATSPALSFESTTLDVIDRDGEPWLRGPQIGDALGYSKEGRIAIDKLYKGNADEFTDTMTALVKLPTAGGEQLVRIFSLRGAHLLGMFARTDKAAAFRRWVLDVLDQSDSIQRQAPQLPPVDVAKLLAPPYNGDEAGLTPAQHRRIAAHAVALTNEAFGLVHQHILGAVAGRCVTEKLTISDSRLQQTLDEITLGTALARYHAQNLDHLAQMAGVISGLARKYEGEVRDSLRGLFPARDAIFSETDKKAQYAPTLIEAKGRRELTSADPSHEKLASAWEEWCATRVRVVDTADRVVDGVSFQCMLDAFHLADPDDLGRKVFDIQHVRREPHFAQKAVAELGVSRQHAYRLLYRFRAELVSAARRLTQIKLGEPRN